MRPFTLHDVADVLAYAADDVWGQFLPVPTPYQPHHAEAFVARQLKADHEVEPRWALEHEGAVVGAVEIKLDHEAGVATLHYALARSLWGQGLMTEAAGSVVDRVFGDLPHVMRVASWADLRNRASWRVMEKLGMTREGVFRSARVVRGERVDDVHYAILRDEWEGPR